MRGWMELWKEERWNQELIGGKNEKSDSSHSRSLRYTLSLSFASVLLFFVF